VPETRLFPQVKPVDEIQGQASMKGPESAREALRLLVSSGEFLQEGIEHGVKHEAALLTVAELDLAAGIGDRLLTRFHQ
jgi:hypothetical protein